MATIRKTPSGTWQCQVRKRGYPSVTKTFRRKRDAEDWSRQTEDEMARGLYIDRSRAERLTVSEAVTRYLKEVSPTKSPETSRSEHSKAKHIIRELGGYSLAGLLPERVAHYRDSRLEAASQNQVRLELALLSHVFTTAMMDWSLGLPFNPVASIRKPSPGKGRNRRLTGDEEERLITACTQHSNPMLGWIVRIALTTAMRKSEILTLERSQVDLGKRVVTLTRTKNGDTRAVPLSKEALTAFQEALHWPVRVMGTDLLFPGDPGKDRQRRPYVINKVWQTALKRAGIDGLRFHDLRHEATSRFVEAGLSDQEVSSITGHRSMQMLKRYTHLRGEDLVNRLDHLQGAG
ncbi:MAG: site-specific integrase [Magnetococcales bacterium]|nr:site-specific integrase [Magnetococcales bacterium]